MATIPSFRPRYLCVDVVVREYSDIEALDHVIANLKSFLDVSKILSVAVAAQYQPIDSQSLTLLEHAAVREKKKLIHWSSDLKRNYRQYQFETALNTAAARGHFAGVRWLRSRYYPKGKFHGAERAALFSCNLQMLHFLHDNFSNKMVDDVAVDSQDAIVHAAANGRLDLVQWYCEMKGPYAVGWNVMDAAVANNCMTIVQYLITVLGNRCTRRGLESAALNGHLDVVKWLHDTHYYEIRTFKTLENAIIGGHLNIVQYVMQTVVVAYTSWTQAALTAAVTFGQRHILEWLHHRALMVATVHNRCFRFEIYTNQLYAVAKNGHLKVLQWLHEHKYPVHCRRAHVVRGAAAGGHQNIIEWMEFTFESLARQRHRIRVDGAGAYGDLQFVQWLSYQKYRFTTHALDDAAAGGFLPVVCWMHENVEKSSCTVAAMDRAAANGHLDVVKYLHQNRKEGCTTAAMDNAARHGHYEVVKFLHDNRSEYCTAMAGETQSVAVLQFLKENKRLRTKLPKTIDASTIGNLELLQWLYAYDRRHFGFEAVVDEAREHNHFHILRWLETLPEAGRP
ncbi:Myosin light chain kinase-related [Plasmopara halstedii]|uniref:Myosin light chain kinase-related n=1 Tax=Plasmopara halstedii TaxID=4781 RepID=A0A0P1ATV7_PLAHL|nr:Myosin light chain kinase-related [Plasmopara halstedii]CEG44777.1 Myosin light chain kinase-related [Plasmopara halstedii]|eukprot:XP_024581146.1 Myosin light chain kinase-related [Plasmopara halstedii]